MRVYIRLVIFGRVKSFNNNKERILKPNIRKDGYRTAFLCKNNTRKAYLIHRLVAIAFIPNINNYPQVNHKDEKKSNNNVENLEWCTNKYNSNYGTKRERLSKSHSIKSGHATERAVLQINKENIIIDSFKSITEANKKTKISISNISQCAKGLRKRAGGYIWRYKIERSF